MSGGASMQFPRPSRERSKRTGNPCSYRVRRFRLRGQGTRPGTTMRGSAGRRQRFAGRLVDLSALQGFGAYRSRRREQEALPEAHIVVQQIEHHAFALDTLRDQVDAGTGQKVGEILRPNVELRADRLVEQ